ncbi:MAG: DUF2341 domain-containing protein, partial [Candidatus Hodarchaeota archaeon]
MELLNENRDILASKGDYLRTIFISPVTPEDNYTIRLNLSTAFDYGNCLPNGDDIRFYDASNNSLPYWIEEWNITGTSIIWVKVLNAGTSSITMTYGNSSLSSASNGDETFLLFDDFSGAVINASKWNVYTDTYSTVSVTGGIADIVSDTPVDTMHHISFGFHDGWVNSGNTFGTYFNNTIRHTGVDTSTSWNGSSTSFPLEVRYNWLTEDICWINDSLVRFIANDSVLVEHTTDVPLVSLPLKMLSRDVYSGPGTHFGSYLSSVNGSLGQAGNAIRGRVYYEPGVAGSGPVRFSCDWILVRKCSINEPTATLSLHDGIYVEHFLNTSFAGMGSSIYSYSYNSGNIHDVVWDTFVGMTTWDFDAQTRLVSNTIGALPVNNGTHDPTWIFTNASLGNTVLISVDGDGDHSFNVSGESIVYLPGYGPVWTWELTDLTQPPGMLRFEKSTGMLIDGNVSYSGGTEWYAFSFVRTNAPFKILKISGLFDGLYIDHLWEFGGINETSKMTYTNVSGNDFHCQWLTSVSGSGEWDVNNETRVMSNNSGLPSFMDGAHDPGWIYSDVSAGDNVSIAVDGAGDHEFQVTGDLHHYILGYGYVDVWILEDLTEPPGTLWYEKSTGILLNGTVYWGGGIMWCTYHFVGTNAPITPSMNYYSAELQNASVSPGIGSPNTTSYNFSVVYTDMDNNEPVEINVTINGTGTFPMIPEDPLDTNMVDGAVYYYTTTLDIGYYQFQVNTFDGSHSTSTNWTIGPEVNPFLTESIGLINPNNNSNVFNDLINFTWTSLELPIGPVNFTWQLSNATNFTVPLLGQTGIPELPGTTSSLINVDLPSGIYYWRVRPEFNDLYGNWADFFMLNVTRNDIAPELTAVSVSPTNGTGSQLDLLNFSVVYTDADDNYPDWINVSINGTLYAMQKVNSSDIDYTDGCSYQQLTSLDPGVYDYYFECNDGKYGNITSIFSGYVVNEENLLAPWLQNATVTPTIGLNDTIFNFTVWYYDTEKNWPENINITINSTGVHNMTKVDPSDTNVTDGMLYSYTTTLDWGKYQFQINCSDGAFTNATNWTIGPDVNPFLLNYSKTIFFDDFESGFSNWESMTGLWHLTDTTSSWPDPCHSPTHSMWFGQESNGTYDTGVQEYGELVTVPIDLSVLDQAFLEFFHWRQGEGGMFDNSYVNINVNDGAIRDLIYQSGSDVPPWERLVFNISQYCVYDNVRIEFIFDTLDGVYNYYRGWLVDDVKIYSPPYRPKIELMAPSNGSTEFNGIINFTWINREAPVAPINYMWQLSNESNFSTILNQTSVPEAPINTTLLLDIDHPTGTYYWRVRATWNGLYSNWTDYRTLNIVQNNISPELTASSIFPPNGTGTQMDLYNFSVLYTDADDNFPDWINVSINGKPYAMQKVNGSD